MFYRVSSSKSRLTRLDVLSVPLRSEEMTAELFVVQFRSRFSRDKAHVVLVESNMELCEGSIELNWGVCFDSHR
jgi:hypothetical protein